MSIKLFVLPFIVLSALCYKEAEIQQPFMAEIKAKCLEITDNTDAQQKQIVMNQIGTFFPNQNLKRPSGLKFGEVNNYPASNIDQIQNKQIPLKDNNTTFVFRFVLHNVNEIKLHHLFLESIEKIGVNRALALESVFKTDCIYTWQDNDEGNKEKYLFFLYEMVAVQLGTLVTLDTDHIQYNNIAWQIAAAKNLAILLDNIHKTGYILRGMRVYDVLFGTKLHHGEVHNYPFFGEFEYIMEKGGADTNPPTEEQIGIIPDAIKLRKRKYDEDFDKFKLGLIFYSLFTKSKEIEDLSQIQGCDNQDFANKYMYYCSHIEQIVLSLINYSENGSISLEQVIDELGSISTETDKNIPVKLAQNVKTITTQIQALKVLANSYLTDKSKKQDILNGFNQLNDSLGQEKTTHNAFLTKVRDDVAGIQDIIKNKVAQEHQIILSGLSNIPIISRELKNVDEASSNKITI